MIERDQPTIFGDKVTTFVSSVADGNMKKKGFPRAEQSLIEENRKHFLDVANVTPQQTVLVALSYETDDFVKYKTVGESQKGDGMVRDAPYATDALATNERGVALFLPIADCVGAVFYDPTKNVLMVSHLGRHSTEQFGGRKSVEYLVKEFGVNPANLLTWLSPSPSRASYPMFAFENRGIQEVICEQLLSAGVAQEHIEKSDIDTSRSFDYFSHSEFKKGNRKTDGRFAIVAMLK